MCKDMGTLQAFLDNELPETEHREVEKHLQDCANCREKLQELLAANEFVHAQLTNYHLQLQKVNLNSEAAWQKLVANTDYNNKKQRKSGLEMFNKYKKIAAVAAGVAVISGALSFNSVRGFAAEFLNVFRVEKIQTISISAEDLNQLRGRLNGEEGRFDLDNFGEVEVANKNQSKELALEEARKEANFAFRAIEGLAAKESRVFKEGGNQISFKLDVGNVNKVIKSLGGKVMLPGDLAGKEFKITIQDAYRTTYFVEKNKVISHVQMRSPEMAVPEGVNVLELRQALLELPFLPDNLREQLAAIEDWQRTVPIPAYEGSAQEVNVDGTQGVYISNSGSDYGTLIWQKDGVINMLQGSLGSGAKALELAGRLK